MNPVLSLLPILLGLEPIEPTPAYSALAPLPCPTAASADLAADWRETFEALRRTQAEAEGLPPEAAARVMLLRARAGAQAAVCDGASPSAETTALADGALTREGPDALKDALRGLLALALERAGHPADAAPHWQALRNAERSSEWLVRAWLAGGDASVQGELAFSGAQLYRRALEAGAPPARCYAAWRLVGVASQTGGPEAQAAAMAQAREVAAGQGDPVCAWVSGHLPPPAGSM